MTALPLAGLAETTDLARELLTQYGLVALFGIFILEGAMLLYFAPSESLVPAAVLFIGDTVTEYALIISIAVVGATIGQVALFAAAKRGGREYLLEKRWFRISEEKLERFDGWFQKWGPAAVLVSNSLLFTRGMLTVPAGFARMSTRRFAALSAVGTLIFETALALIALGVLEIV